jgi:tRNA-2-methylthio-N6-dimethylallyladenosine synthase
MIPDCAISTDIIAGYCSETEEDHKETLSLMEEVGYDYAYMFKYSPRPGTYAANNFPDDVSEEDKSRRLSEIIEIQHKLSLESNLKDLNKIFSVLVEGISKKSDERLFGRNSQNKVIVFPGKDFRIGTYVNVLVTDCTSATLLGHITREDDLISKINKKI